MITRLTLILNFVYINIPVDTSFLCNDGKLKITEHSTKVHTVMRIPFSSVLLLKCHQTIFFITSCAKYIGLQAYSTIVSPQLPSLHPSI